MSNRRALEARVKQHELAKVNAKLTQYELEKYSCGCGRLSMNLIDAKGVIEIGPFYCCLLCMNSFLEEGGVIVHSGDECDALYIAFDLP